MITATRGETMFYAEPQAPYGRATHDPSWKHIPTANGGVAPRTIEHIQTGQRIRRTQRGWEGVAK